MVFCILDRLLANDASMTRQHHDQYCNSPAWSLLWTYSTPHWTLSPEVTSSSGTPLPDPSVRADFIQVVYAMAFWPCLRRQRQNYGCQMHFINQTPTSYKALIHRYVVAIFGRDEVYSVLYHFMLLRQFWTCGSWFFGKHPWLVSILFHSIEKIWPHNSLENV